MAKKEDAMVVKQSEYEVGALLETRVEACRARDIDRLMSLYSPDIVYFDVVPTARVDLCHRREGRREQAVIFQ
jgi:ketosteroid isomerase-like protein